VCCHLGVEEDFGAQEAFVAHIDVEGGLTDGIDSSVLFDPLSRVRVVLCELFYDVWTDVTVTFLQTEVQTQKSMKKH